jgi:hypothetical protein
MDEVAISQSRCILSHAVVPGSVVFSVFLDTPAYYRTLLPYSLGLLSMRSYRMIDVDVSTLRNPSISKSRFISLDLYLT